MTQPQPAMKIGPELIDRLLRAQHPNLAHLRPGRSFHGMDNVITRLGESYAVRTPRIAAAVGSLVKELTWLPPLRAGWTFPAPVPIAAGEPGEGYPWPWSVVTWVPGEIWADRPWNASAAVPFARALREVHVAPASLGAGALPGGEWPDNREETATPAERSVAVRSLLARLHEQPAPDDRRLDGEAAEEIWRTAVAAPPPAEPVFIHADLHLLNVVSLDGAFGGITDWGDLCVGDPAVDVGRAAMLLPDAPSWHRFLEAYGADDALTARARGLGLGKAAQLAGVDDPRASRSGWNGLTLLGATRSS